MHSRRLLSSAPTSLALLLALAGASSSGCTFIVDFDRGRVVDDAGAMNDAGPNVDAGSDAGGDVGPMDAFALDTNEPDAFLDNDAGVDAFAGSDSGVDAFAGSDAGVDAFAGNDAFAPDAFTPPDAFAPDAADDPDAFTAPDAFVPDAFTAPDASEPDAFMPVAVSFATSVAPIFQAHCAPCHTTSMSGGHNIGNASAAIGYSDSQLVSYTTPGQTKGHASLTRIQNGSMPQGGICTGNPATDIGNPACLTAAEQATIQAWIAGGQLP